MRILFGALAVIFIGAIFDLIKWAWGKTNNSDNK